MVLLCLARESGLRLPEVAERIGISERSVQRIVAQLVGDGLLRRHREGRRSSYELVPGRSLPHPLEGECTIESLIHTFLPTAPVPR